MMTTEWGPPRLFRQVRPFLPRTAPPPPGLLPQRHRKYGGKLWKQGVCMEDLAPGAAADDRAGRRRGLSRDHRPFPAQPRSPSVSIGHNPELD